MRRFAACILGVLLHAAARPSSAHGHRQLAQQGAPARASAKGSVAAELALSCDAEDAAAQAQDFSVRSNLESACAPHVWLDGLQALTRPGRIILLDIGCNIGYHSVELFDTFAPELGINKRSLHNVYSPLKRSQGSAKYLACMEEMGLVRTTPYHTTRARHVEVHCLEPGDKNFQRLEQARNALFGKPNADGSTPGKTRGLATGYWYLHNKAVSNVSGTAGFTKDCDNELCSLQPEGASTYTVQVTTVDELFESLGSPQNIPVMKIDTEGFDVAVMMGAKRTLAAKAVQVFIFEYHGKAMWNVTTGGYHLKDWLGVLEQQGYVCYMEGAPFIHKLSRGCWMPQYEDHQWRNVVCGLGHAHGELLLDAHSYLRQVHARKAHSSLPEAS